MRKITNMIGRQKITLVFTNQLRQRWVLCLVTHGQRVVVEIAFHSSVRIVSKIWDRLKPKLMVKIEQLELR